jgi:hypothetical protein
MPSVRLLSAFSAGLFLLVVALYAPTLRGEFVYDSIAQVLYSDYIHTPANWDDVLTLRVVGRDELDRNRPMHLASLMLDAAIWKKEPFGYRLTSVLLHALNAALLFLFIAVVLRSQTVVAGDGDATANVAAASSPPAVLYSAVFGAHFVKHCNDYRLRRCGCKPAPAAIALGGGASWLSHPRAPNHFTASFVIRSVT